MEVQQFYYDNKIVKNFLYATILWGVVGMLVGLLLAFMFLFPNLTDGISWLSFGRLRPLHTNAVIFAFVGNARPIVTRVWAQCEVNRPRLDQRQWGRGGLLVRHSEHEVRKKERKRERVNEGETSRHQFKI